MLSGRSFTLHFRVVPHDASVFLCNRATDMVASVSLRRAKPGSRPYEAPSTRIADMNCVGASISWLGGTTCLTGAGTARVGAGQSHEISHESETAALRSGTDDIAPCCTTSF